MNKKLANLTVSKSADYYNKSDNMADIELVIKIPEEEYKSIKAYTSFMPWAEYLIKNGTPLDDVFDKIKAEIREFSVVDESGTYRISTYLVDQIIDKYRSESDCRECKTEYDCYECEKYVESEE